MLIFVLPAYALTCREITNMIDVGVPDEITVQAILEAPKHGAVDVECLRRGGASAAVIAAAEKHNGGAPAATQPPPLAASDADRLAALVSASEKLREACAAVKRSADATPAPAPSHEQMQALVTDCDALLDEVHSALIPSKP